VLIVIVGESELASTPLDQTDGQIPYEEPCFGWTDGRFVFAGTTPGRYDIRVTVSDGLAETSLVFPVYLNDCGGAPCSGNQVLASEGQFPVTVRGKCACEVPELDVTDNVQPFLSVIEPLGQNDDPRPVARYQGPDGNGFDFVESELIVQTDDAGALADFLARWNGEVLGAIDPAAVGGTGPAYYRVRIDTSIAELSNLEAKWGRANGASGQHFFSSTEALELLAAALSETERESAIRVSFNPLLELNDFASRSTVEQPMGPAGYTSNAYEWSYMNRGSAQDIGTAEAWTLMDSEGLLSSRPVQLGIADGGFIVNDDFPPTVVAGSERIPNPSTCTAGTACPWHGVTTAMTAAALPDNGIGVAGPAGPIANLTVLPSPAPDLFAYLEYIFTNIPGALGTGPQIINISASVDVPSELCFGIAIGFPVCEALHGLTQSFRDAGALIFASAGNDGVDVDAVETFVFIEEEGDLRIPCELDGVVCVGGLAEDTDQKDGGSAFGSKRMTEGTVDIFGPYTVFALNNPAGADPLLPAQDFSLRRANGTSFASPYVAGVAALIWAAKPTLTDEEVEDILLSTAHTTSSDGRVPRWVNALAGVQRALLINSPPFLRITSAPSELPQGATLVVSSAIEELEGEAVTVTWTRSGTTVGTNTLPAGARQGTRTVDIDTTGWPAGLTTVEGVATDSAGNMSAVASVEINVVATTATEPRTVALGSTGGLCPQDNGEPGDQGDANFGRGPDMEVTANLTFSADRRRMFAVIRFVAVEPDGGDTRVEETFVRPVYTAAEGEQILSATPSSFTTGVFRGDDAGPDVFPFCGQGEEETRTFTSGLVERVVVRGDSGGDDVSQDANCDCDTRIDDILFFPTRINVALP
ncbi:MAG: S8 family serine peptidase, partial [Myxococcota bacterium]